MIAKSESWEQSLKKALRTGNMPLILIPLFLKLNTDMDRKGYQSYYTRIKSLLGILYNVKTKYIPRRKMPHIMWLDLFVKSTVECMNKTFLTT